MTTSKTLEYGRKPPKYFVQPSTRSIKMRNAAYIPVIAVSNRENSPYTGADISTHVCGTAMVGTGLRKIGVYIVWP